MKHVQGIAPKRNRQIERHCFATVSKDQQATMMTTNMRVLRIVSGCEEKDAAALSRVRLVNSRINDPVSDSWAGPRDGLLMQRGAKGWHT